MKPFSAIAKNQRSTSSQVCSRQTKPWVLCLFMVALTASSTSFADAMATETTSGSVADAQHALNANANSDQWMWWKPVGNASLTWGFWKIYDSELRTQNGKYVAESNEPLALVITYSRDIDAEDLLDATVEQWEHLGYTKSQIDTWLPNMEGVWPNVEEGDRLIYVLSNQTGQFYYQALNDTAKPTGSLNEAVLADAFANIWLSPDTAYPTLRLALIGGEASNRK
ncbi:chalcone isomerase family protein [Enterovibrio norvegicus]|uniref:chalcone isomerase family protein n=1 Tax=Enterovibrio norvegicus TaxID=188144 RepID=UPI000C867F80|nr:chalcone isomerase family protein [Enterovibrio norvegicus]PML78622.1 hypothetical protein BCT69_04125 [Enterovibrio norvegicus]